MSKLPNLLILLLALALIISDQQIGVIGVARADDLEIEVIEEGFTDIPRNEDGTVIEPELIDIASVDDENNESGQETSDGYQQLVNDPKLYESLVEADIWGEKSETGENEGYKRIQLIDGDFYDNNIVSRWTG